MKKFGYLLGLLVLVFIGTGAVTMEKASPELGLLLPESINGWTVGEKDRLYNPRNLFDYIDGGAELYISYGFKYVLSRTYSRSEQPDIVVDLFDMGTSRNAFGVFSHAREKIENFFGQGSQYTEGLLLFWKDRYFISILASPETSESKEAVFNLAGIIEAAIPEEGPLPELLILLPEEGLVEESIRYFHHYIWLNSHYFVADDNILHIDDTTDAVLAKYGEKGKRIVLLLVKYQKEKEAKVAYADFVKYYLPELTDKTALQIEDGTWTGCRLFGDLLAVVFNAQTEAEASGLMEAVRKK